MEPRQKVYPLKRMVEQEKGKRFGGQTIFYF